MLYYNLVLQHAKQQQQHAWCRVLKDTKMHVCGKTIMWFWFSFVWEDTNARRKAVIFQMVILLQAYFDKRSFFYPPLMCVFSNPISQPLCMPCPPLILLHDVTLVWCYISTHVCEKTFCACGKRLCVCPTLLWSSFELPPLMITNPLLILL